MNSVVAWHVLASSIFLPLVFDFFRFFFCSIGSVISFEWIESLYVFIPCNLCMCVVIGVVDTVVDVFFSSIQLFVYCFQFIIYNNFSCILRCLSGDYCVCVCAISFTYFLDVNLSLIHGGFWRYGSCVAKQTYHKNNPAEAENNKNTITIIRKLEGNNAWNKKNNNGKCFCLVRGE